MRNFKITIIALISSLLIVSCYDDEGVINQDFEAEVTDGRSSTLTFGRYYGKCIGNGCIEIFRLQERNLVEDIIDSYPSQEEFYRGDFVSFRGSEKIDVSELLSEFPERLLNAKETFNVIGTPDISDQGGIYLAYEDSGIHKQWLIDTNTANQPKYILSYMALIEETVNQVGKINNQY